MAPKKAKTQKSKMDQFLETRLDHLKQKKKIESNLEDSYLEDLASLETHLEEQSNEVVVHRNRGKKQNQYAATYDSNVALTDGLQCIACLEDHFLGGKYLLDCRHCLCNDCFIYWSNISNKCPACLKKSNTVMIIFQGCTRVKNVSPKYMHQDCQICGNNNNELQMYYCDMCSTSCVHVYCEPGLMVEIEDEVWICKDCRKEKKNKGKGKSRYNFQYVEEDDSSSSSLCRIDEVAFQVGRSERNNSRQNKKEQYRGKDRDAKNRGRRD